MIIYCITYSVYNHLLLTRTWIKVVVSRTKRAELFSIHSKCWEWYQQAQQKNRNLDEGETKTVSQKLGLQRIWDVLCCFQDSQIDMTPVIQGFQMRLLPKEPILLSNWCKDQSHICCPITSFYTLKDFARSMQRILICLLPKLQRLYEKNFIFFIFFIFFSCSIKQLIIPISEK